MSFDTQTVTLIIAICVIMPFINKLIDRWFDKTTGDYLSRDEFNRFKDSLISDCQSFREAQKKACTVHRERCIHRQSSVTKKLLGQINTLKLLSFKIAQKLGVLEEKELEAMIKTNDDEDD